MLKSDENIEQATFAAGCFWVLEDMLSRVNGVLQTRTGYTGGNSCNPTYHDVCQGKNRHVEAVQVLFDSKIIDYKSLLTIFWILHDPASKIKQGSEVGVQYRPVIFYHSDRQKVIAAKYKKELSGRGTKPVVTEILPLETFWLAEEEHQKSLWKLRHS